MLAVAVHVPAEESNNSAVATFGEVGCVPPTPPATSTRPSGSNIVCSFAVVILVLVGVHVWLTESYNSASLNQWYGQHVTPPTTRTEPSDRIAGETLPQNLPRFILPVTLHSSVLGRSEEHT